MIQVNATSPVNWRHPLNRSLATWFLAGVQGRTGGKAWIDLVQGHHGTLGPTMLPASDWIRTDRPGTNQAIIFDETDGEYVILPKAISVKGLAAATLSIWFKPAAIPALNASLYFESTATAASTRFSIFHLATTGYIQGYMRDTTAGTGFAATESVALTNNVWSHLVLTADATTDRLVLYRDGVERAINTTAKGGFTVDVPAADIVLASFGTTQRANGQIDDVRIWKRALSAQEVRAYYDISRRGYFGLLDRIEPIIAFVPTAPSAGMLHTNLSGNLQSLFGGMQN